MPHICVKEKAHLPTKRDERCLDLDRKLHKLSQEVKDLCLMMMGEVRQVKNPELKEIGSIPALREVLDNGTDDNDMKAIAPLVCIYETLFFSVPFGSLTA